MDKGLVLRLSCQILIRLKIVVELVILVKAKPFRASNKLIFLAELGNSHLKRISGDRQSEQRRGENLFSDMSGSQFRN